MSLSICTYCGARLEPGEEITLAHAAGDPQNFDTEECLLAWLKANGFMKAAEDYTRALWVVEEGFPEGFPPKDDE